MSEAAAFLIQCSQQIQESTSVDEMVTGTKGGDLDGKWLKCREGHTEDQKFQVQIC